MPYSWKIHRDWEGETCAILANGPSMSQEVADAVRGKCRVIAVNNAYRLAPWADMLYACDAYWWADHPEAANFEGLKVTTQGHCPVESAMLLECEPTLYAGFDERSTHVRSGKNSGYQAIHVAVHLGVSRILLCGFDMRMVDGMKHWFGDYISPRLNKESPYSTWVRCMEILAPILRRKSVEVINCTRGSAVKCFPFMKLEQALESMRSDKRPAAVSA